MVLFVHAGSSRQSEWYACVRIDDLSVGCYDRRKGGTTMAHHRWIVALLAAAALFVCFDRPARAGGLSEGDLSLEVAVSPIVKELYFAQASYAVWEYGEVSLGAGFVHMKTDQGRFNGATLVAGYRQYFWRGLHLAVSTHTAYDHFRSSIDGQKYKSFWGWIEVYLGYRFEIELGDVSLLIIAEPGLGYPLFVTNPWPDAEAGTGLEFAPMLWLGVEL